MCNCEETWSGRLPLIFKKMSKHPSEFLSVPSKRKILFLAAVLISLQGLLSIWDATRTGLNLGNSILFQYFSHCIDRHFYAFHFSSCPISVHKEKCTISLSFRSGKCVSTAPWNKGMMLLLLNAPLFTHNGNNYQQKGRIFQVRKMDLP